MKRKGVKMMSALMLGGCLLGSGCSFNGLLSNIWLGFGTGIGAIPSQLVVDQLFGLFGVDNNTQ